MSTPTPTPTPTVTRTYWTVLMGDNGSEDNPSYGIWTELGSFACPLLGAQDPPFDCVIGVTGEGGDPIYNSDYLARMEVINNWYYPEGLSENETYSYYLDSITATFGPTATVPGTETLLNPYLNLDRGAPFLVTPTPTPSQP